MSKAHLRATALTSVVMHKNYIIIIITTLTSFGCYVICKEYAPFSSYFDESSCNENFALQLFHSSNETEVLNREQDKVLCHWRKNFEIVSRSKLKAIIRLSDPGEEGISGGTLQLPNGTILYLDGSGIQMMFDFKESLNLKVEYSFTSDWGIAWDAVVYGHVDLGVPLRTIQYSLGLNGALRNVGLLHPLVAMSSNVYFRPPPTSPSNYLLFWPLQLQTWLVLLAVWILCIVVCFLTHSLGFGKYPLRTINRSNRNNHSKHGRVFVSEVLLWAVAIISGKEYPVPKKGHSVAKISTSLRIALLSVMFLSIILLAVYTAKIMAIFSISSEIIKSPDDLLKYKYTLSSYSNVHMERIFKSLVNKSAVIQQAMDLFFSLGRVGSMKRLLAVGNPDPRFAFLTHPDGFFLSARRPFINHTIELCSISFFMSTIKSPRSMYIRKGSKFRDVLNWKILQLSEAGINSRHQKAFNKHFEYTCFNMKGPYQELNILQTSSLFLFLDIGASLAIVILLYECAKYHNMRRLKNYM